MVDSSDMQRADWLKYRIRPAFTVYELACLLSRHDPKRVFDAAQADDLSRQATERGITGNGDLERLAYPFDSPEIFRATLLSKPEWLLPSGVCCVLETIRTATGLPMMSPIEAGRAKELATALELIWPDELDAPRAPTPAPSASAPAVARPAPVARPLQAQRHQEAEILRVLLELGHQPKALPKHVPGKPGVKAEVRGRLSLTVKVFDKAWERLSAGGEIAAA